MEAHTIISLIEESNAEMKQTMPSEDHGDDYLFPGADLRRKEEAPNTAVRAEHGVHLRCCWFGGALQAQPPAPSPAGRLAGTGGRSPRARGRRPLHRQTLRNCGMNFSSRFSTKRDRRSFVFGEQENPLALDKET